MSRSRSPSHDRQAVLLAIMRADAACARERTRADELTYVREGPDPRPDDARPRARPSISPYDPSEPYAVSR